MRLACLWTRLRGNVRLFGRHVIFLGSGSSCSRGALGWNPGSRVELIETMTVEDVPRKLGVADRAFRASWAAEYAGYLAQASESLRDTATQAEQQCYESLKSRGVRRLDSSAELEPEERRLFTSARSTSHAGALLSLFAIEVALKAYQIRDRGQQSKNDHDLARLFESLNEETRARLKELCPEVMETVTKHRKGLFLSDTNSRSWANRKASRFPRRLIPFMGWRRRSWRPCSKSPQFRRSWQLSGLGGKRVAWANDTPRVGGRSGGVENASTTAWSAGGRRGTVTIPA